MNSSGFQLKDKVENFIQENLLLSKSEKVLVGVSGGIDSVVLFHLLQQLQYDVAIAHCNYQLRGQESDDNEHFVKDLANKHNVEFLVKKFNVETSGKQSVQMICRELRYNWFEEAAQGMGITKVGVAHHADDNIETSLYNLIRGTGIKGIRGMLPIRERYIRPLLNCTRSEIEEYAAENKIAFSPDSSNEESKYTRNWIRNEWIPMIESRFPSFKENYLGNLRRFHETEEIFKGALASKLNQSVERVGSLSRISKGKILNSPNGHTLLHGFLTPSGFTPNQIADIFEKLKTTKTGSQYETVTHRLLIDRKFLMLYPLSSIDFQPIQVNEFSGRLKVDLMNHVHFDSLELYSRETNESPKSDRVAVAEKELVFPLTLRSWRNGDYFYPAGMGKKKKKLSNYFTDEKFSMYEKETALILENGDGRIIWVVGHRLDERFGHAKNDTPRKVLRVNRRKA